MKLAILGALGCVAILGSACHGEESGTVHTPGNEAGATASLPTTTQPTGSGSFTMPDEVGQTLQQADVAVRRLAGDPGYTPTTYDLTGKSRTTLPVADWRVCAQSIPAGTTVQVVTVVRFDVVQRGETCPSS
ncbi:MAG: hypothetical protein JO147_11500 [Actinobacteria bacterium]|nr:hypothetical protein [Actinomycetota bacterium]